MSDTEDIFGGDRRGVERHNSTQSVEDFDILDDSHSLLENSTAVDSVRVERGSDGAGGPTDGNNEGANTILLRNVKRSMESLVSDVKRVKEQVRDIVFIYQFYFKMISRMLQWIKN